MERDQVVRELRLVNRSMHLQMGFDLSKWRSTILQAMNGGAAISLLSIAKDVSGLQPALLMFLVAGFLGYLAVGREMAHHTYMQEKYAEQMIASSDASHVFSDKVTKLDKSFVWSKVLFGVSLFFSAAGFFLAGSRLL